MDWLQGGIDAALTKRNRASSRGRSPGVGGGGDAFLVGGRKGGLSWLVLSLVTPRFAALRLGPSPMRPGVPRLWLAAEEEEVRRIIAGAEE
jgi:hypothetical protein